MRQQIVEKMLNHAPLRSQVEIDKHVAAKNYVHAFHERHAGVVGKIQAAEADVGPRDRTYL
jgi:hypothetical protein